jgi:lysophospholipase L1-like esterase
MALRIEIDRSLPRRIFYAALTVSLSVLFCAAVFEYGVLYFFFPEPPGKQDKEFDSVLGWRYIPGTYSVKPDNSLTAHSIEINQFGLRGAPPRDRQIRALVFGDSFTFGRALPAEALFTARLQGELDKKFPLTFEIVNAGVEGYGTAQQLLLIQRLADEGLTADVYILQVFTNDILDNLRLKYYSLETTEWLQPGYSVADNGQLVLLHRPQQVDQPANPSIMNDSGRSFRTYKVIKAAIESYAQRHPEIIIWAHRIGIPIAFPQKPGLINAWYTPEILPTGIPLLKAIVRQVDAEVRKLGGTLLVVAMPSPLMVYPETYGEILKIVGPQDPRVKDFLGDVSRPQRIMQQICEEAHIPFLDLLPVLAEHRAESLYIPREGHLTKRGHEVVAGALAVELIKIRGKRIPAVLRP